ncbi:MAG: Lrp/AsnC family transcriptional regulator [Candidimonas sp.]|nr:MAG: Lrp/AsnC family transcriptional regulator [Candidimonas sp.]TAM21530.1 MAG: Lrp/AsnC family transcriptional regulator [Candidimonas sp.]TAM77452.1 MAG: Lrp/AsnC family transcriptional regulator [Candidimonas sp.]
MKPYSLDNTDRRLLDLMQKDARQSLDALADRVCLSTPAVQRRIKRMRDAGVILGDVVVVNPVAIGLMMTFIVNVQLERERSGQVDEFQNTLAREPLVQQYYYVTGEGDFMIIALAKNMDEFEALTRRLFFDNPNVRGFKTSVVMGKSLRSLTVPAVHAGISDEQDSV